MRVNRDELEERLNRIQRNSKQMMERIDKTITNVSVVKADLQQQGQRMKQWEEGYRKVITKMGEMMTISNCNPLKLSQQTKGLELPTIKPIKFVVQRMLEYSNIAILTGAGVSKDSGIPTFRGKDGLYTSKITYKDTKYAPQEFITYKFYKSNTEAIWKWVQQFRQLVLSSKPCQNHRLIHLICSALTNLNKKVTLVTTNIDGFHSNICNQQYNIQQIHGNCNFQVCQDCNFRQLVKIQSNRVCSNCGLNRVRPNILLFDQKYEGYYGGKLIQKNFDFVMVVGSSLETGMSVKIVKEATQVIQINPNLVIQVGKVYQFCNDCRIILNQILSQLESVK